MKYLTKKLKIEILKRLVEIVRTDISPFICNKIEQEIVTKYGYDIGHKMLVWFVSNGKPIAMEYENYLMGHAWFSAGDRESRIKLLNELINKLESGEIK